MDLAFKIIEITAPVFLLAGLGFTWVRLGFEYRVEFVTRLAMTLALPALIFTALMQSEIPVQSLSRVSIATIVAYAVVMVAAYVLTRIAGLDLRTYLVPLVMGNTGNIGLPLAFFAFGDEGLGYAVVIFAISSVFIFSVGIWVVSGKNSILSLVREPIVPATLLGGLFLWQGWQTPVILTNTLSLLGQMAIPMMLLTLGVAVARLTPRNLGHSAWIALAKLVLCAGLAWAVGLWFDLPHVAFGILVLQLAAPVAVTSYLVAEKYKADAQAVAGLVVVSTVMSLASFPILLALLL